MKKFQILIFGASTTHGNWDELGGWSHRIRAHVIKKVLESRDKYHGHVFNLGVPGDTTEALLNRIESEIKARLFYPETIIMVSVGTNDSRVRKVDNKNIFTADEFRNNQEKLIKTVKKYSNKILFVGLTPMDEKITSNWSDYAYLNKNVEKFNKIINSLCHKNDIEFVDLYKIFNSDNYLEDIYDGLHPNSAGHKKIFELIKPTVDNFLE